MAMLPTALKVRLVPVPDTAAVTGAFTAMLPACCVPLAAVSVLMSTDDPELNAIWMTALLMVDVFAVAVKLGDEPSSVPGLA